jgi:hypothetical protein
LGAAASHECASPAAAVDRWEPKPNQQRPASRGARNRPSLSSGIELEKAEFSTNTDTFNSYLLVTGHPRRPNYWKAVRYFFHIFDGRKVFPDEDGNRLSSPELAIRQAKVLAAELSKACEFCRSSFVFVLDENGKDIFGCRAA